MVALLPVRISPIRAVRDSLLPVAFLSLALLFLGPLHLGPSDPGRSRLASPLGGGTANAQEFGQNKIQYEQFDFQILHTPNFAVYFYNEGRTAAQLAARMSERWYARLSSFLDSLDGTQPLILYAGFPHFEQTNVVHGIGTGTGGVTERAFRRITLPLAGPLSETDHVIGHELVHAFQYDMSGGAGAWKRSGMESLPLWFIEGMAEYFAIGPTDPNTAMWMRDALERELPSLSDLDDPEYFPYRYGHSVMSYIGGRWGDRTVVELFRSASRSGELKAAMDTVLGVSSDSVSRAWHAALHSQYGSIRSQTDGPDRYGRELVPARRGESELNVSPVLSPDGRRFIFFSSRDLFSIDLFLANAETGEVERNLFSTALDPHLQSLEFIRSAGSWSPDGRQVVIPVVEQGRPALQVLNVENGSRAREFPLPELTEALNPAWSPDGSTIIFSAIGGGFSDLYQLDLRDGVVRQLTDDPFSDLHPTFTPDGARVVFASDRFTTDLERLDYGHLEIVSYELSTRRLSRIAALEASDNTNPQYSAAGDLSWISNHGGIPNIYRLERGTGTVRRLTSFYTGVAGITPLSPAISVAASGDRLVYSHFREGNYSIWELHPDSVKASPVPLDLAGAATLPPGERISRTLTDLLDNADYGLPPATEDYPLADYRPSFRLLGAGQTSLGIATSSMGTAVGGGVTLYWTDMLGNRNLQTSLGVESRSNAIDVAALVGYYNIGHRLYWGGQISQIPYVYAATATGYGTHEGQEVYIEEDEVYKETDRELSGRVSYPFNRATRLDLGAGYRNISFSHEIETRRYSPRTGELLDEETNRLSHPANMNLGTGLLALVHDNAVLGATSPIVGRRARAAAFPSFGTLTWVDLLAEHREYIMPFRPVTLAGRLLHYGRYGGSAEDDALSPLFLGSAGLVRGYGSSLFGSDPYYSEDDERTHPLYGTRLLVGNVEIRYPIFGLLRIGRGFYGPLPLEAATFFDTGVAWRRGDEASFLGGDRDLLSSFGQALRLGLFGYVVFELDYVRALNGPERGWKWQFNLTQGF